ncbi:hypothetical protein EC968_003266 [Mortierella alpina]|nr:hypothetical protein EC968_003266 [Mortierella alpina]
MTITHTETALSRSSGLTVLSTQEQQIPPFQQFRVGADGPIIPIEAEWDKPLQQFCFRVDQLQNLLGVRVDRIKRVETGALLTQLRHNDVICEPYRYAVSTGILEVETLPGAPPSKSISEAHEFTKVIEQFDRLYLHIKASSYAEQRSMAAEYQRVIERHYPALVHCQDDAASIEAVKIRELIMYPVPRRFFVLLRNRSRVFANPLFRPLQLYLLCECGIYDDELDSVLEERDTHLEVDSTLEVTHEDAPIGATKTHLSHHAGYRIKEPTKFCKDLGSHLLPVLKFLHYSAIFAGIVVPALASINVSGWFTVAQSFVNYNNTSWSEPWLKTLDYVAGLGQLSVDLKEDEVDLTNDDIPRAIKHPEYGRYRAHLAKLDPDGDYGNLIPNFCNRTGRLKYVCKSHDDDAIRTEDSSLDHMQALGNAVVLDRAKGEVTFKMDSKATTKHFYGYLMATPSVRKVNVELGPGTTGDDFKTLRKMLTEANMDNITLIATGVNTPGPYCNEVLKIMVNHRCQSLTLYGLNEFYSQMAATKISATTRLKSLALHCSLLERQWEKLDVILKLCPALRTLTIMADYSEQLCRNIHSTLPHLKRLEFAGPTHKVVIRTSKDSYGQTFYTTELDVTTACDLISLPDGLYSDLTFLRLHWLSDPDGPLKLWLAKTLQDCPRLLTFDLRVPLKHLLTWVTLLTDEFKTVNDLHNTPVSRRIVRLQSTEDDHHVTMTVRFQGHDPQYDIKVEMVGAKESIRHLKLSFDPMDPLYDLSLPAICSMTLWPMLLPNLFLVKTQG